jgi:hypothetical protein
MPELTHCMAPWANFYVIAGSAAAALTGLVFVVITLITGTRMTITSEGVNAFTTPTIVHFSSALMISLLMNVPWVSLMPLRVLLVILALAGLAYALHLSMVGRRAGNYELDIDDWLGHVILPTLGYCFVLVGGGSIMPLALWAFYFIAAGTALFIFVGIRNAWDVVTYLAIKHTNSDNGE